VEFKGQSAQPGLITHKTSLPLRNFEINPCFSNAFRWKVTVGWRNFVNLTKFLTLAPPALSFRKKYILNLAGTDMVAKHFWHFNFNIPLINYRREDFLSILPQVLEYLNAR
jgi:hypothetical protein